MYQYSLGYVKRLFNSAIEKSPAQPSIGERLKVLIEKITQTMYMNVSRGLFVTHKVLFSFLMSTSINRNKREINEDMWGIFLRGSGIFNKATMPENPSSLISVHGWDLAYYLEITFPDSFAQLTASIIEKVQEWEEYCQA